MIFPLERRRVNLKSRYEFENELEHIFPNEDLVSKPEIEALYLLMIENEVIEGMITSSYRGNRGLLFLTNINLVFLSEVDGEIKKGIIPLNSIQEIQTKDSTINIVKIGGVFLQLHSEEGYGLYVSFVERLSSKIHQKIDVNQPLDKAINYKNRNIIVVLAFSVFILFWGGFFSLLGSSSEDKAVKLNSGLGITLEEFKNNFNSLSTYYEMDFRFDNLEVIKNGSERMYVGCTSEYFCVMGLLNTDNTIKDMAALGGGVESMKELNYMIMGYPLIIRSLDKSLSESEGTTILHNLGISSVLENLNSHDEYFAFKGRDYKLSSSDEGILLGITYKEK